MSLYVAVVTLLAVVYANSASSDEGMGLCYRCPLHHLDGDEGSAYAWVKSFLHEIKRRCPGLKTTPKGTQRSTSGRTTSSETTATYPKTSTTNPMTSTTDLISTVSEPSTTKNNPSPKTTEPPTSTVSKTPTTTTDPPTTSTEPPTTTTDPPTTTTDPPTTTTDPPTTNKDPPTTTTDPPTTTTDPLTTNKDPSTTTTVQPTTTIDPPTTTVPPTTPTEPTTTTTKPVYVDCQALLDAGHNKSGVYNITPSQYPDGLEVYCNMNTKTEKGWIVFQRRVDDTVSFIRSWGEYRDGFGDKEGSFWLGNEILRRLTEPVDEEWQMRVRLDVAGSPNHQSGAYNDFRVDGENYTLHVGEFSTLSSPYGLSDCLSPPPGGEPPSNGQPFTTYNQDNDAEPDLNCADELKGGWWFYRCTSTGWGVGRRSNLNGEYSQIPPADEYGRGIVWSTIYQQITRTAMIMRRDDSS
ncbi:tenascin-R-like [Asterias rubens]|uniref:tenascin-R-like n=1 Tax=Asterias rubens TaxID=7604 RepID=UPI00145581D9|nr:tenascin-R-like [Asterias rubens]